MEITMKKSIIGIVFTIAVAFVLTVSFSMISGINNSYALQGSHSAGSGKRQIGFYFQFKHKHGSHSAGSGKMTAKKAKKKSKTKNNKNRTVKPK